MSRRKRALFVSYGGGHVAMVQPVIAALERDCPEIECLQIALTTAYLKANAVRPAFGYQDFLDLVDTPAALAWGERLLPGNISPDVPLEETRAYLGINYLDLMAQHGAAGAAEYYRQHGRFGFMPRHFMRRVLDKLAPDVVVATNSPRSERAGLDCAKTGGIPTVGMVDLFGLDSDTYVLHETKPDWTCVISDSVRARLILRGFPGKSVVVTGNPAFDGLFTVDSRERANRFLVEHDWQQLKPVLFAGHWEPQTHPNTPVPAGQALPREIEAVLREHVRQREELALIVRYHPSDWNNYPRLPDGHRIHFSEPPREPIHPLILCSQAVVVQTSTVGLEAAVGGKAVVSVENSPAAHVWFSLAREGVSTPAAVPSDLPSVLDEVLAGRGIPSDPSYCSDGHSSGRVADVVKNALVFRPSTNQPA